MGNANDQRILDLKSKIKEKKKSVGDLKFTPITNCSIDFEGERYNLHANNTEGLTILLIRLNAYRMSMKDLKMESCIISGYEVQDWITDIQAKLKVMFQKKEREELKILEKKLEKLLSEDKRTELEIDSIESLLK
jgi:hypothetical protein